MSIDHTVSAILRWTVGVICSFAAILLLLPLAMRGLGYYVDNPGWEIGEIAAAKGDPKICLKLKVLWNILGPTGPERRAECIYRYASILQDPIACEMLLPSEYALACLSEVGGKLSVGNHCTNTYGRNEVYCSDYSKEGETTIENPQIENCSLYQRKDLQDWCYKTRTARLDVYECEKIIDESERDNCEDINAFKHKDPSLCSKIKDVKQKKYCETIINVWLKHPALRKTFYFGG